MIPLAKILVHINADAPSRSVIDCAVQLAKATSASLTLVDVTTDGSWPLQWLSSGIEHAMETISHAKMDALRKVAETMQQVGPVECKVLTGRTSLAVTRQVLLEGFDLVVTSAKGRNSRREGFFGTTARRLMRKCPCPVLLVQPGSEWERRRIVAAVDAGSPDRQHDVLNGQILAWADGLRRDEQQHPEIVAAWSMYVESALRNRMDEKEFQELEDRHRRSVERQLDDLLVPLRMGIGSSQVHVRHGEPTDAIVDEVNGRPDSVLVMGTVGRSWLSGLLFGNTAERITDLVDCSVLAIKPLGFVSPVRMEEEASPSDQART